MSKLVCIGAALSSNPDTKVIEHPQGVKKVSNGVTTYEVNKPSNADGKLYFNVEYIGEVMTSRGPVNRKAIVKVWADENGQFLMSAEQTNALKLGKEYDGSFMKCEVNPYEVMDSEGTLVEYSHAVLPVWGTSEDRAEVAAKLFNEDQLRRKGASNPQREIVADRPVGTK